MPGAGLNSATDRKASPERSALKPYWGKPTGRNFRGGYGNGGIIRSPRSPMTLLARDPGDLLHASAARSTPLREGDKPNGEDRPAPRGGPARTRRAPAR